MAVCYVSQRRDVGPRNCLLSLLKTPFNLYIEMAGSSLCSSLHQFEKFNFYPINMFTDLRGKKKKSDSAISTRKTLHIRCRTLLHLWFVPTVHRQIPLISIYPVINKNNNNNPGAQKHKTNYTRILNFLYSHG